MRLLISFIFLLSLPLIGQEHTIYHSSQFEKIQINNNSKSDHVYSLEEDDNEYLWVAEQSGLYRFDGDRFTLVNLPKKLGATIRQLNRINRDTLLVATTLGLGIVNTKNFETDTRFFPISKEYFLEDNFIRWVIKGKENTFWVFTKTAVHLLDKNLNTIGFYEFEKHPDIIGANPTRPICFPFDKNKLIFKSFQADRISGKDKWQLIDIENGMSSMISVSEIENLSIGTNFQVNPNEVIFVNRNTSQDVQAFYYYNHGKKELKKLMEYEHKDEPTSNIKTDLLQSNNGITFSRFKTGYYFDSNLKKITEEYRDFTPYSLYHKMKNGVLYVGNSEGLYRLTPTTITISKPKLFTTFFSDINFNDQVTDFLKKNEDLYIATHNKHVFHYNSLKRTFNTIQLDKTNSSGLVWNMRAQGKFSIWIGTQEGLFVYNIKTKQISRWKHPNLPLAINKVPITTQYMDSRGILWIGMGGGNGVLAYDSKKDSFKHYQYDKNKFPLRTTNDISEDANGNLWMGYENGGGLIKWERRTDSFTKIKINTDSKFTNDRIRCLLVGYDNLLWIGTRYGLFSYNESLNKFEKYSTRNGLADDIINKLYQDKFNRIWIGTVNGLSILDCNTKRFITINQNQGIPGREISSIKEWDSDGNSIFIGATNGFCIINSEDIKIDTKKYNLYVEPIELNGISTNFDINKEIKLSYKQNTIRVNFGIINHSEGSNNSYYYKIQELDTSWLELKTKGSLLLTGLGPGQYHLNLRTCVNGSNCFDGMPMILSISPPFWKSIWFILLIILLSVFLTRVFYTLRIRNLKQIEKMRNQISMDLHDDIGSSISSVRILSDILANQKPSLQKNKDIVSAIKEQSSHIGEVLEEIIWNVNPKNDLLENIVLRMQQYGNETLENAGKFIEWELDIHRKEIEIEAQKRKELYLFFKEAVNNIAKHSKCKTAQIKIKAEAKSLIINIYDDGVGFDSEKKYTSNGIESMKERAKKLRATILIESVQKQGTNISLIVPL